MPEDFSIEKININLNESIYISASDNGIKIF